MAMWLASVAVEQLPACSGWRTSSGTWIDSRYGSTPLPRIPWTPSISPWSEVKTTIVSSVWPLASSASSRRTTCASLSRMQL